MGLERGVFPCLTKLDQDRGTFFSDFLIVVGGFTVSVAGSWVLSRGDSHDPSCVAFPTTSRPPAVLPVSRSPIGRLPILVIRLVTSFLPLQWQQFDEW